MKYVRIFLSSFAESFGNELAVGTIWIWRGAYFGVGLFLVLSFLGLFK